MNVSEIADRLTWDANGLGELCLHVPLFGEEVPFLLFPKEGAGPIVTERMAAIVSDVIALKPERLQQVKDLLWDEANFAFQVADYGVEAEDCETPLAAHLREFGIASPDDAYRKSSLREIHVVDDFDGRFAELKFDTGAENRIGIIVRNGAIIDWDEDGTYLGWFDEDEQAAARKRARILA